jgi:3-dehydroquinate dehydratase/shikimate dehydrogenase
MYKDDENPFNQVEIKARYVFEMIYDPPETRFMKLAKAAGAEVIPGVEMFVQQAARQFEIWTGKPAPWDEMLRVVTKILAERATAKNGGNEAKKK